MTDKKESWISRTWNKAKDGAKRLTTRVTHPLAKKVDAETFDEAYETARRAGSKTFIWKKDGKAYNTEYKGTPKEQMATYGITDEQLHDRNIVQKRLAKNLYPYGYDHPIKRFWNTVVLNKKQSRRMDMDKNYADNKTFDDYATEKKEKMAAALRNMSILPNFNYTEEEINELLRNNFEANSDMRLDYYNIYNGIPQKHNTLAISDWTPSKTKGDNTKYYYKDNQLTRHFRENLPEILKKYDELTGGKFIGKGNLGACPSIAGEKLVYGTDLFHYTIGIGQDEHGCYLSYYDLWDMAPSQGLNDKIKINTDFGRAFEVYDRIYFDPQTHQPIDVRPEQRSKLATLNTLMNDTQKAAMLIDVAGTQIAAADRPKQTNRTTNRQTIITRNNEGRS